MSKGGLGSPCVSGAVAAVGVEKAAESRRYGVASRRKRFRAQQYVLQRNCKTGMIIKMANLETEAKKSIQNDIIPGRHSPGCPLKEPSGPWGVPVIPELRRRSQTAAQTVDCGPRRK